MMTDYNTAMQAERTKSGKNILKRALIYSYIDFNNQGYYFLILKNLNLQ